jgi:hypothetical protein
MTAIRAILVGSDLCQAEGHVIRHNAPVLGMCRLLVELGYDPTRPLYAYRGDMLAMKISSIGYGAKFTVEEGPGPPRMVRFRADARFPKRGGSQDASEPSAGVPEPPKAKTRHRGSARRLAALAGEPDGRADHRHAVDPQGDEPVQVGLPQCNKGQGDRPTDPDEDQEPQGQD